MKKKLLGLIVPFVLTGLSLEGQVSVSPGTTLKLSGPVYLVADDLDVSVDGTLDSGPGSVLKFSGSQPKSLSGSAPLLLDHLEISKSGGIKVSLGQDAEIISSVSFHSGLLELNGRTLLLRSGAVLTGETEESRITGVNGGYVEITASLNAPAAVNPGNLGAILTSGMNMGPTIIRRGHAAQTSGSFNGIHRYFDVIPENNSELNATMRFAYFDAELNGLTEAGMLLGRSQDLTQWHDESGGVVRNTSDNYIEKSGIAQFSRWTLFGSGALPVELVYFRGSVSDAREGWLYWSTAAESGFSHFEIQGSENGRRFDFLGVVHAGKEAGQPRFYDFREKKRTGIYYYRLKMVDMDGTYAYSPIVTLDYKNPARLSAFPNPVVADLLLESDEPVEQVEVYNARGEMLQTIPGRKLLTIPMRNYPSGLYLIRVNQKEVIKVWKQ